MLERFITRMKNTFHIKRCKPDVESWHLISLTRALMGASVITVNNQNGDDLKYRFSYPGFVCFVVWYLLYFYCSFVSYMNDQTVMRILYDTKLKGYADALENVVSLLYVLYAMWKVPFDLNGFDSKAQEFVDIDAAIKSMGEPVDVPRAPLIALAASLLQIGLSATKMLVLWSILRNYEAPMPYAKMFQITYTEMLTVMLASYYCIYLILVRERYKILNKLLLAVKEKNSREYFIFVRERRARNEEKASQIRDKYVCEKIKACANIYSMLYRSTARANMRFGFALAFTMLACLIIDTMHLFYLMEATASGLFHDIPRYCHFLVYVGWQILVATGVTYVMVWLCELTVAEAKFTGVVIHQIINSNNGPGITSEVGKEERRVVGPKYELNTKIWIFNYKAMQLSLQILHQVPVFTARGFYKMDYLVVLEGARTIITFLVMLIQFVTDPPSAL